MQSVLVAHPDGALHELARRALGPHFIVRLARTRAAALNVASSTFKPDAIVTGADMPGVDLARDLHMLHPTCPFVFVVSPTRTTIPWGLKTLGTVVPSTFDGEALGAAVDRACAVTLTSSGVQRVRRDSEPLFRAVRAIEHARQHDRDPDGSDR